MGNSLGFLHPTSDIDFKLTVAKCCILFTTESRIATGEVDCGFCLVERFTSLLINNFVVFLIVSSCSNVQNTHKDFNSSS